MKIEIFAATDHTGPIYRVVDVAPLVLAQYGHGMVVGDHFSTIEEAQEEGVRLVALDPSIVPQVTEAYDGDGSGDWRFVDPTYRAREVNVLSLSATCHDATVVLDGPCELIARDALFLRNSLPTWVLVSAAESTEGVRYVFRAVGAP